MKTTAKYITLICLPLILTSCFGERATEIRGTVENGPEEIVLSKPAIHYKFAEAEQTIIPVDEYGRFRQQLSVNEPGVYFLQLYNEPYPVYIEPNRTIQLRINGSRYPQNVQVRGFSRELNDAYQQYLEQVSTLERHTRTERRNFLGGKENDYLNMIRLRYQLAKEYLAGTPFELYMHRHAGEYLTSRLEKIRLNKNKPGFNAEKARKSVIEKARQIDFFTLPSLKAQRAGIRDFTDAWAKTYGVQTRLEEEYGRSLMEYDWKRLGFNELNEARHRVLDYIDDDDALSHAKMYLTAEMLGEGLFDAARDTFYTFREDFSNYPDYVSFLNRLYSDVKTIQPGNPAPDFQITAEDGRIHTMQDYRGKYVLIDFWATWCAPCLNEFPYMEELYSNYDRHDLEIISISIDEDKLAWESMIERFPHPWIQLWAGQGFTQETLRRYRAGGIPFYVLVDRNGDILRVNDIRPSFNFNEVLQDILYEERGFAVHQYGFR